MVKQMPIVIEPAVLGTIRTALSDAVADLEGLRRRLGRLQELLDGNEVVDLGPLGLWTKTDAFRLWDRSTHLSGVRAHFQVLAEKAAEWVGFSDVTERSGLSGQQQMTENARLSRVSRDLFAEKRLPFESRQGTHPVTRREEMLYRMPADIAAWWFDFVGISQIR